MTSSYTLRFLSALSLSLLGLPAHAQVSQTYTTTADFQQGVLNQVNTSVADQLQLDTVPPAGTLPFVCVALNGLGRMVRVNANTGEIMGDYRTAPQGQPGQFFGTAPSRTAVDSLGNVWVSNEGESGLVNGIAKGSVVKIGIIVGGTRTDALGNPSPNGEYLKPPFLYSTAVDRNGDGLIRTSRGLNNVLNWTNVTDGLGGTDGLVQDADDELILVYQRVAPIAVLHVSVDSSNDVWVGGYPAGGAGQPFQKLNGSNGAILSTVPTTCGGYGGVISPAGILWSTSPQEGRLLRLDTNTLTTQCLIEPFPPFPGNAGVTVDSTGAAWSTEFLAQNRVNKRLADGTQVAGFPKALPTDRTGNFTLASTSIDNDVWVSGANASSNRICRIDTNGILRKKIDLPAGPEGVSVDSNGKVWVSCAVANKLVRIDPNGGADGLGSLDLQVTLPSLSNAKNFGSMCGEVPLSPQQPNGSWSVVYDSGSISTQFGKLSYTASVPAQTALAAQFRIANTPADLALATFQPINNGVAFSGVFGRFVEARFDFTRASTSVSASPVLFDFSIESLPDAPDPDCQAGLRVPASLLVFPEFDNRTGDLTLLTVTNTAEELDAVKVEFVYIGRMAASGQTIPCLEYNRTEMLTSNDTISVITSAHNPNQSQGYVYVFAKNRITGKAMVHNHLIGHAMIIQGLSQLDYSYEPEVFLGIGAQGDDTDRDNDGLRDLNDIEYSCAPDEILIPRFLGQRPDFESQLVLLNLTGGSEFTATLDLLAYNDNEEAFSGQFSFQCWTKVSLLDVSQVFLDSFLRDNTAHDPQEDIGVETGWLRLNGLNAVSTAATISDPAFLAMLIERTGSAGYAVDAPFISGTQKNGDLLSRSLFEDSTP